ncbi:LAFE_0C07294g1_1 [Lachancea fermentati]|uniref:LAFE_0C07294g1_1 n=1 Tax=Lachancea fermentati TaxID=4955 RepID=A0A1G4MA45_LACFM|nr:LAFE_0C07294g1_1 [Lachancea fermentati]
MLGFNFSRNLNAGIRSSLRHVSTRRQPPRKLLQMQAKRNGDIDPRASSQLIVTSLRDIISMFQPSNSTQDDDELDAMIHREGIISRLETGELRQLLLHKFSATSNIQNDITELSSSSLEDLIIPGRKIKDAFLSLTDHERELIETSLGLIPIEQDWDTIPFVQKQLAFYMGYGSYGPRLGISFEGRMPEDFSWKVPSSPKSPSSTIRKLPSSQKTNILTCIPLREKQFQQSFKTLDGGSRFIIWAAILVTLIAGWTDYQHRHSDNDTKVTTAKLIEVPISNDIDELQTDEGLVADEDTVDSQSTDVHSENKQGNKKWYQIWK